MFQATNQVCYFQRAALGSNQIDGGDIAQSSDRRLQPVVGILLAAKIVDGGIQDPDKTRHTFAFAWRQRAARALAPGNVALINPGDAQNVGFRHFRPLMNIIQNADR